MPHLLFSQIRLHSACSASVRFGLPAAIYLTAALVTVAAILIFDGYFLLAGSLIQTPSLQHHIFRPLACLQTSHFFNWLFVNLGVVWQLFTHRPPLPGRCRCHQMHSRDKCRPRIHNPSFERQAPPPNRNTAPLRRNLSQKQHEFPTLQTRYSTTSPSLPVSPHRNRRPIFLAWLYPRHCRGLLCRLCYQSIASSSRNHLQNHPAHSGSRHYRGSRESDKYSRLWQRRHLASRMSSRSNHHGRNSLKNRQG